MKNTFKQKIISLLSVFAIVCMLIPSAYAAEVELLDPFSGINGANWNGIDKKVPNNFGTLNGAFNGSSNGTYVSWENVNFSDNPVSCDITYASPNMNIGFEIRLDNVGGTLLAEFKDTATGSWGTWVMQSAKINQKISGVHTVYLIWKGEGCNVSGIKFYRNRNVNLGYTPVNSVLANKCYNDITDDTLAGKLSLVKQLGFLEFVNGQEFEQNKKLTIGEYAVGVSHYYADEIPQSDRILFRDVLKNYPLFNAVNYAAENGVIKDKNSDGLMEPYEGIRVDEFVNWLIGFLGYKENRDFTGSAFSFAGSIGLFSGIELISGMELTRGMFAELVYNSLELDYKDIIGSSGTNVSNRVKRGILNKTRNINKSTGVVEAIASTALASPVSGAGKSNIIINSQSFTVHSEDVFMYLGYDCDYYYNEETYELAAIIPNKSTKETVIGSYADTELEYIDNTRIEYSNGRKSYKTEFDKNTYFIYNGKAADDNIRNFVTEKSFSGNIRVIENKNSTAVIIDDYQNVRIKSFDNIGNAFLDDFSGKIFRFDEKNTEYAIYKNGVMVDAELVTSGDCAIVYESKNKSGGRIIRVVIDGFTKISGKIESTEEENILIDGINYKRAKENTKEYSAGTVGVFTINPYNEVVWYEDLASGEWKTVLFCGACYDENGDEQVNIRVYDENKGYILLQFTDKPVIDGIIRKTPQEIMKGKGQYKGFSDIEKRTPALIKQNDEDKVVIIDTVAVAADDGNDRLKTLAESSSFAYRTGIRGLIDAGTGMISQPMSRQAKLISYYSGYDDEYDTIEEFKEQMTYKTRAEGVAYSIGDSMTADIFLWKNRPMGVQDAEISLFFVYESRGVELNEDDESVIYIEGYLNGAKKRYRISDRCTQSEKEKLEEQINSLSVGDFSLIQLDSKDQLLSIEIYCYADGSRTKAAGMAKYYFAGVENGEAYAESVRYIKDQNAGTIFCYGTISDYDEQFFEITLPSSEKEYLYVGSANIVRVVGDKNRAYLKSSTNPQTVISSELEGCRIFYYILNGSVRDVVVFDRNCF